MTGESKISDGTLPFVVVQKEREERESDRK